MKEKEIAEAFELAIIKLERLNETFIDEHGAHLTEKALESFTLARGPLESVRRIFTDGRKAI